MSHNFLQIQNNYLGLFEWHITVFGVVFPVILLEFQSHGQRGRDQVLLFPAGHQCGCNAELVLFYSCLPGTGLIAPEPSVFLTLGSYYINLRFWQVDSRAQLSVGPFLTICWACLARKLFWVFLRMLLKCWRLRGSEYKLSSSYQINRLSYWPGI